MDKLITAQALAERLRTPEAVDDLLLIQVTSPEVFASAHLPGAELVTPAELISGQPPATGRMAPLERLIETFERVGLTPSTTVVTYDDEGGGWAGRLAWTLDVIGHDDWLYLDGGLHAWAAGGGALSRDAAHRQSAPQDISVDRTHIAETEDILQQLAVDDGALRIWDCRSKEEYVGQKVVAARGGHIPGAVNLDWLDLMDQQRNLCLIPDLEEQLAARGITPDRDIITHCQTHHRSGLTYMVLRLLGFPRVRAYHGSWSEWGNREDTPVEV